MLGFVGNRGGLLAGAMIALCSACGAKTGLEVPDASLEPDAEVPLQPCVVLPFNAEDVALPLQTTAQVGRADVALLMDVSASMGGEISAIRRELRDVIVPGIEAEIPEVRLSVSSFSDFPEIPYGLPGTDAPFRQRVAMTNDIADVQGGVDALSLEDGRDHPEAQVEALFQLATGEGLIGWVEPSLGCATGGFGYPCFRPDALPVILLFTDAPFHEGPSGGAPYMNLTPRPHSYSETRLALLDRGIRVISFFSGARRAEDRADLELLGRDTESLDSDGRPLVFDIGTDGRGLGDDVIDAIKIFADNLIFDVDLVIRDEDPSDGVDATQFVERVVAVSANPPQGVGEIDAEAGIFRRVESGTQVTFEVRLRNDAVAPGAGPQRFELVGSFRADGRDVLGESRFEIVIPGADGSGCEPIQ